MSRRSRNNFNYNMANIRKEGFEIEQSMLEMSEIHLNILNSNFRDNRDP
jgi:hypothetical protein